MLEDKYHNCSSISLFHLILVQHNKCLLSKWNELMPCYLVDRVFASVCEYHNNSLSDLCAAPVRTRCGWGVYEVRLCSQGLLVLLLKTLPVQLEVASCCLAFLSGTLSFSPVDSVGYSSTHSSLTGKTNSSSSRVLCPPPSQEQIHMFQSSSSDSLSLIFMYFLLPTLI